MTQDQTEFLAGMERLRLMSDEELLKINENLLRDFSDVEPGQDDWFVYRGVSAIIPQLLGMSSDPPTHGRSSVYYQANVYQCRSEDRERNYKYDGVLLVNSANDNAYSEAA